MEDVGHRRLVAAESEHRDAGAGEELDADADRVQAVREEHGGVARGRGDELGHQHGDEGEHGGDQHRERAPHPFSPVEPGEPGAARRKESGRQRAGGEQRDRRLIGEEGRQREHGEQAGPPPAGSPARRFGGPQCRQDAADLQQPGEDLEVADHRPEGHLIEAGVRHQQQGGEQGDANAAEQTEPQQVEHPGRDTELGQIGELVARLPEAEELPKDRGEQEGDRDDVVREPHLHRFERPAAADLEHHPAVGDDAAVQRPPIEEGGGQSQQREHGNGAGLPGQEAAEQALGRRSLSGYFLLRHQKRRQSVREF
jgi:hypothetical protein